jgi:hypothetical protein
MLEKRRRTMAIDDKGYKVFWGLLGASSVHVIEEYVYPGGFLDSAREIAPEAFEYASIPIVVGVNTSMIAGCLFAALMRKRTPFFGLSMASLLFVNSILHTGASIRTKKYQPGLVTGLCLYIPLSLYAFNEYQKSPEYNKSTARLAKLSGLALHTIPFVSFAIRKALTENSQAAAD